MCISLNDLLGSGVFLNAPLLYALLYFSKKSKCDDYVTLVHYHSIYQAT
jgi:hypothetical protein